VVFLVEVECVVVEFVCVEGEVLVVVFFLEVGWFEVVVVVFVYLFVFVDVVGLVCVVVKF